VRLPGREPDGKPKLKPGITWTRLIGFIVIVAAIAVFVEHFAEGTFPETDCEKKEIDTGARKEGICFEGNTRLVVVDRHTRLRIGTLEAELLGIRNRGTLHGPAGRKAAEGKFVTVEVALTNTTDALAAAEAGQFLLYAYGFHSEAVGVDRKYEPRSFLARHEKIPAKGTEVGTVTFEMSTEEADSVPGNANFDIVDFGDPVPISRPNAIENKAEYGVIRTYK
jgi:hypothetical protein